MTDIMSKKERSKRMSMIRSKWTKQERYIHNFLKGNKIKHEMHPKIAGSPDIIIPDKKLAIFLHGCFWHGCKKCYHAPSSNVDFWKNKIRYNRKRDLINNKLLRKEGWNIITIWEHEIPCHSSSEGIASAARKIITLKLIANYKNQN